MTIKTFTFNPFQTNCYVCHDAGEAVIVDPGCYHPNEYQALIDYVESLDVQVKQILLTHGHIDHIFGVDTVADHFGMGYKMHRADLPLISQAPVHAQMFGTPMEEPVQPIGFLEEGDRVSFGNADWLVFLTPGHSPGSICFYDAANKFVLSGDVIFYDSIGRTDLWQGSLPILMASIFQKIMPLDDDVELYPGHGPATSVGRERAQNPFLKDGPDLI